MGYNIPVRMQQVLDVTRMRILITGGHGFLGRHLVYAFMKAGARDLVVPDSSECNLLHMPDCEKVVRGVDIVVHLAARVGGIGYNEANPAPMFYENVLMGTNIFHASWKAGVQKFVGLGTICCYPKYTPVPFKEESLWNGYPEQTNAPYGMAKKMLLVQAQAYRKQYGFNAIFLLPVNMYGPFDNFNPDSSHVIPALIKKFIEARDTGVTSVEVWGTGRATREFLYVEDAAHAIFLATQRYNKSDPVNIGAGFEISIRDLAEKIRKLAGYKGRIVWDTSKPDGQPRRMLSVYKAEKEFGFTARVSFDEGLVKTIKWYETQGR